MKEKIGIGRVIDAGYQKRAKQEKSFSKEGYTFDKELSNHNQQFYFNPTTKKLITNVSGTHNAKDWGTNLMLGLGQLKKTKRYKEANRKYNAARTKYNPSESSVVGHSLGGGIASGIGKGSDKITTYNKGVAWGQKTRKNEKAYRTKFDPVSMNATKIKTLAPRSFNVHSSSNLKGARIYA